MSLRGSCCQAKHLLVFVLDCLRLVVTNDHSIVRVAPSDCCLVDLKFNATQVLNVYSLVILLVDCLKHNLLLLMIDLDDVVVFRVRQVPDTPLKALCSVLADEVRVGLISLHEILLRVKTVGIFTDFIFPGCLADLLGSLPFSQNKLIAGLITFFN